MPSQPFRYKRHTAAGVSQRWLSKARNQGSVPVAPEANETVPGATSPDDGRQQQAKVTETAIANLLTAQYGANWQKALHNPSNRKKLMVIKPTQAVRDYLDELGLGIMAGNKTSRQKLKQKLVPEIHVPFPHTSFFAGAKVPESFPKLDVSEVAVVGRSNVGKSTLINALARTSVVRTSDKPGMTQQINFYGAGKDFNLVDMPGYGFAFAKDEARVQWQELIDHYLKERKTLVRLFVLIDSRTGFKVNDAEFFDRLEKLKVKTTLVLTKCDDIPRSALASRYMVTAEIAQLLPNCLPKVFMVSGKHQLGINDLRKEVLHIVGKGRKYLGGMKDPLRAEKMRQSVPKPVRVPQRRLRKRVPVPPTRKEAEGTTSIPEPEPGSEGQ
ncbi:hypothetical protein IWQ60_009665 [Tieghemiomyces parasiticus]|uniref:EngB-type G domain-containing protein n=1 Tax=Tieghemiomyces parasiticus TaxID=78921 RepID=A0A9W8DKT0_9FUNG|nr:hypothetical protein IWQ60_009665 [Tieghemiomyces parasiticus]